MDRVARAPVSSDDERVARGLLRAWRVILADIVVYHYMRGRSAAEEVERVEKSAR